jgi:hypothetical protein
MTSSIAVASANRSLAKPRGRLPGSAAAHTHADPVRSLVNNRGTDCQFVVSLSDKLGQLQVNKGLPRGRGKLSQ